MQRPPLFEANCFIYWKNHFETYVKSKDIDLWHIIVYGDYKPTIKNKGTRKDEVIPYEKFEETHKKMISKNDEAKMVLYIALPKKEYESIFMCKKFVIYDDETIDCVFARFNTIITSLKALDESFSSHNHVRKFLRALPTKWSLKVTEIEESKDLLTLPLDELIDNLKVYEVVLEKDSDEEYAMAVRDFKKFFKRRGKFVRQPHDDKKSFRKVKEEKKGKEDQRCFNDEEDESKRDEICLMALDNNEVRLKVKLELNEWIKDSGCSRHMTGNKDLFSTYEAINGGNVVFGSNTKSKIIRKGQICDKRCKVLFSETGSEILKDGITIGRGIRKNNLYIMKMGNSTKDSLCLTLMDDTSTLWHRRLGYASMRLIKSLSSKELVRNLPKLKFENHFCDACNIRKQVHESHKAKNMVLTTKCLELLHMDLFGPLAVKSYGGNFYTLVTVDDYSRYTWTRFLKHKNEAFDHFEILSKKIQVQKGCLIMSSRTDHGREFDNEVQFGAFCDAIEPKNNKEAIKDESWTMAMQEELNQFVTNDIWSLIPPPDNQIGAKWVFKSKLDENGFVSKNKARLVAQGYNQQEGIDFDETYAPFEMSMMGELNFFLGLQIKQLEDVIFFNQSKYIKEMLKKSSLEDSKLIKTPMSSETKLTREEDKESVDNTKYRGMIGSLLYLMASRSDIMFSVCLCARFQEDPKTSHLAVKRIFRYIKGTTHLGLWYPKGTGEETIVYANSNHAGDYVDHKSTSGLCTFMGCCLTSWFSKKQTALAISTTKAEYVSAEKACQQALWMKQALVDYDIKLDDIPILCDNKGSINLSKNLILYSRTKHIEIRHHFLHDNVQKGNISIEKVSSEDNIADILTKPIKREPFKLLRLGLGRMEPNA
ncbi:retrovirus-related pol polyprotein from transposon TNT 1-94 [Tanacetum coccineum]